MIIIKILNAFAGLGANFYLLNELGEFNVTAVEINYRVANAYKKIHVDHEIVIKDAYEYIRNNYWKYDIIWASPPCPSHSKMRLVNQAKIPNSPFVYPDMRLYGLIKALMYYYEGNWVVENVKSFYEPLYKPITIGRHYLWSNINLQANISISKSNILRSHKASREEYIIKMEKLLDMPLPREKLYLPDTKGVMRSDTVFRNCVDPKLGKYVLKQLLAPEKTLIELFT